MSDKPIKKRERSKPEVLRRPSLSDVAKYAGVSTATVSRCFSQSDKVTPKLKSRVDEAVAALGYTPHGVARALASNQTRTIGVVVPTLDLASFSTGVQSLQERLYKDNYIPLLATSNFNKLQELKHVENLLHRGVDGIVLVGMDHDERLYEMLERSHIPFVNTWSYDSNSKYPCIGFDNRDAIKKVTEYVLDMGHRNVALVVGGKDHINDRSHERAAGYNESMSARNLQTKIVEVPYGIASGRDALRKLMGEEPRPTAIVCASDVFAIGCLKECALLGIEVPRSVSITGLDDLEISANYSPALTTVHIPTRKMGELAAEYILGRLANKNMLDHIKLESSLIVRETVSIVRY